MQLVAHHNHVTINHYLKQQHNSLLGLQLQWKYATVDADTRLRYVR